VNHDEPSPLLINTTTTTTTMQRFALFLTCCYAQITTSQLYMYDHSRRWQLIPHLGCL
jgi:hypothetical protein